MGSSLALWGPGSKWSRCNDRAENEYRHQMKCPDSQVTPNGGKRPVKIWGFQKFFFFRGGAAGAGGGRGPPQAFVLPAGGDAPPQAPLKSAGTQIV